MPATVVLLNEVRLLDVSYVSVLLIVVVAVGLHVVAVAVVGMSSTVFVHLSRFVLELNRTRVVLNFFVLDVVSFGLSSGFMVMVLVSGSKRTRRQLRRLCLMKLVVVLRMLPR